MEFAERFVLHHELTVGQKPDMGQTGQIDPNGLYTIENITNATATVHTTGLGMLELCDQYCSWDRRVENQVKT